MHEPTTHTRPIVGAASSTALERSRARRSRRTRPACAARPRAATRPSALRPRDRPPRSRPSRARPSRRRGEKSETTIVSTPMRCSSATTARPTGPAPSTTAASALRHGCARDGVPADRHRFGERGAPMVETVRHLHAHARGQAHLLGVRRRCRCSSTRRPVPCPSRVSAIGSDVTRSPTATGAPSVPAPSSRTSP